jgi:hypothetical protein
MKSKDEHGDRLHHRVWDLLPWYANATLAEGERRVVETHLAVCAQCREELAASRGLGDVVRQVPEIAPAPHPARLARIMAQIDADERTAGEHTLRSFWRSPLTSLQDLLTATPRVMRWALLAQLVLVMGLAGGLARLRNPAPASPAAPPQYTVLSDPAPAALPHTAPLRIVFAPGTTEQEIRDLLLGFRGQITAGPSPLGVYTVDVPATPDPLAGVLAHLRKHRQVMLAEPVDGGVGR